jgi:phenylalanyl-tRNA synthetase beta chain
MGNSHNRTVIVEGPGQRQVVCGAPNCRVGLRTAYLDVGKKTIEGVESDGMLASEAELGISRDHSGIVELPESGLGLIPDYVIEVDNKSLTHRPDLWGHHGMAREVAAITGGKLLDPVKQRDLSAPAPIKITVQERVLCPRYSALVFENVTVKPSPLWLRYRLEALGMNSISNIVDVTNYVMAAIAQPMHAFDAEKLHGGEIIVRSARDGEKLAALNGETYQLDSSNLMIADPEGSVALAGVIGGAGSAISESTTRIVLESANFNASSVRKTSTKIRLRTDASQRFEKAQDPINTLRGLLLALDLLEQVSPGIRLVGGLADAFVPPPVPRPIELPLDWLERKLGCTVAPAEVKRILTALEFGVVERAHGLFTVSVPTWRATKDVSIKEDLAEEIGRMIGYDNITPTPPLSPAVVPPQLPERAFLYHVRELTAAQGFTEVFNYSFLSEETVRRFGLDPARHVAVANPIVAEQDLLRTSLLPGVWKNIETNAKNFDTFRLFEIGREIHPDHEKPHLAAVAYAKDDGVSGLLELKRLAECLLPGVAARPAAARAYEHPRRSVDILSGETIIGRLFEFHPRMVETGRAAVLDLDLDLLASLQTTEVRYQPLRRFPTSTFDLSVIAPSRALIGEVQAAIPKTPEILTVEFLREFTLATSERSLSYRLTLGAPDRTLTSEEVGAIRGQIINELTAAGYKFTV